MTPCPYCARTCMGQCLGALEERTQERINKSRRWFTFGLAALAARPRLPWVGAPEPDWVIKDNGWIWVGPHAEVPTILADSLTGQTIMVVPAEHSEIWASIIAKGA